MAMTMLTSDKETERLLGEERKKEKGREGGGGEKRTEATREGQEDQERKDWTVNLLVSAT